MSINEKELREKYDLEYDMYKAYGKYIRNKLVKNSKKKYGVDSKYFYKIPPSYRVKDFESLLSKIYIKNYSDPYNDVTDKVGVRFVVLLMSEVDLMKDLVEDLVSFDKSKDRDFEDERKKFPTLFEYQSVHYIIRNKNDLMYDGVNIKANTPCEIQIRTLLQHAYSEFSHDKIYKTRTIVDNPKIHRIVSRNMAIIELADINFKEAEKMINEEYTINNKIENDVFGLFEQYFPNCGADKRFNDMIFSSYTKLLEKYNITVDTIKSFVEKNTVIIEMIKNNYKYDFVYRQPAILLMYYLVSTYEKQTKKYWPLQYNILQRYYSDMGGDIPN